MMTEKEVINVGLYGGKGIFGGREEPLRARITKCDIYDQCSFYKEGQCLHIPFGGKSCKHGQNQMVKGYTSRAQKYHKFKNEWENHEDYGALKNANKKIGIIADEVVINLKFIEIKWNDFFGRWQFDNPGFGGRDPFYIDYDDFDSDFIKNLCEAKPQAMMGGTIESYKKEEVPLFLAHLNEIIPEKYQKFIVDHPEYDKDIDHTGREAYVKTMPPCEIPVKNSRGKVEEVWQWDGELLTLISDKYLLLMINKSYKLESLVVRPQDDMTVEITDNSQVGENTVYKD